MFMKIGTNMMSLEIIFFILSPTVSNANTEALWTC